MTLTLNFQGQIWNSLYLGQKWSDCHETKSKHIDLILSLKCDHRIWPWLWPWHGIFKVKYGIHYISTKNGPIATNETKSKHGLNFKPQMWPLDLTLAMTLTLNFQGQIWNPLYLGQNGLIATKQKTYRLNSKPQMWSSDFSPVITLTEFSRSNLEFPISQPKIVWLPQNKSTHIEWTEGLNDHQV